VTETLEDNELAEELENLQKRNLSGDDLRNQLILIISKHYELLKE